MLREFWKFIKKLKKQSPFKSTTRNNMTASAMTFGQYTTAENRPLAGINTATINGMDYSMVNAIAQAAQNGQALKDIRIEKKPVEVVAEILAKKPEIQLNDIDGQIKVVEARLKVLEQFKGQTSDEIWSLRYLKARKYYKKYEALFNWEITTEDLIKSLTTKYKLSRVSFHGYSKSVPNEATMELERFGKAWEKVVDEDDYTPTLDLIIDYQGPEYKKDPILLASSPFGKWWYVLGAWDREVEIVDDIIYRGK